VEEKFKGAERLLVEQLADSHVRSVRFYVGPLPIGVWLVTETDAEAKALRARVDTGEVVSRVLRRVDMPESDIEGFGLVVQSEETVARDYEGSWFYAMR
jgi:hypothetical protein